MSTIAIEGLLGVGKSTLCDKISAVYESNANARPYQVLKEYVNDKFLQLFYTETDKYAFSFQVFMVCYRIQQVSVGRLRKNDEIVYCDRSPVGDFVFGYVNHYREKISDKEFIVYKKILSDAKCAPFGEVADSFMDEYWYLWDSPRACADRVQNGRLGAEKVIPLDYYTLIDNVYFILMLHLAIQGHPVYVFGWSDFQDAETLISSSLSKEEYRWTPQYAQKILGELAQYQVNDELYVYDIPTYIKRSIVQNKFRKDLV